MLTHLTIKNYALIQHLELTPSGHLNVITGETGAGKSILLGAIGLLLGNRADTKVLWDENEKCVAEGVFDISAYGLKKLFDEEDLDYENETVLRREVNSNGKSRAFINDTPVTLDVMKKVGSKLMDVHSQHETLDLGSRSFQLSTIDIYASNSSIHDNYKKAWVEFVASRHAYEKLLEEAQKLKQEEEFINFQLNELVNADLQEGQQAEWESDLKIREHAEDIKKRFNQIIEQLGNSEFAAKSTISDIRNQLDQLSEYSPRYKALYDRVNSIHIELADILDEIEKEESDIEVDQEKTEHIKEKLSDLFQLMQKHRVQSVEELIEIRDQFQAQADKTVNLDATVSLAKDRLQKATEALENCGKKLTQSRKAVFDSFTQELVKLLNQLGIPEAKLVISHETTKPGPSGADNIEFLFSANKGIPERPLAQVASGGEFSRVMFCLKYILAEKISLPTLVLDEIDTGVSGEIAIQLGNMMKSMAQHHQLVTISHLPQIAAKADCHFYAFKEIKGKKTVSQIKPLIENERIEEIAKMIGGSNPSTLARENAKELIGI